MRNAVRMVSLLAVLLGTGCYSYGVNTGAASDGVVRRQRGPTFLWGLVGQQKNATHCNAGVAQSESYMPWWGGIVGVLTVGLVVPWRVDYECVQPTVAAPAKSSDQ